MGNLVEASCNGCGRCLGAKTLEDRTNIICNCLDLEATFEVFERPIEVNYNSGNLEHTSILIQPKTKKFNDFVRTKIISIAPNSDIDRTTQNLVFRTFWDYDKKNSLIGEAKILSEFYQEHDTEDKKHNDEVMNLTLLFDSLLEKILNEEDISKIKYSVKDFLELKEDYNKIRQNNPFYRTQLACAGLLHDIGKVFIPKEILKAPRSLTPDEMEIVRHHPIHGYHILNKLPGFQMAANTALFHHEQYISGNGYHNLKGKNIPFYANLISLADIIQVMVNKRAYKEKSSFETTFDMITGRHKGDAKGNFQGYFHPTLVQMLEDNFDNIQSYLDMFKSKN